MVASIYAEKLASINPRLRAYIDWLDQSGQIDRDENSDPVVTRMEPIPPNNVRVFFLRNGYEENFIINPRKRAGESGVVEPIRKTWNYDDGWTREDPMRKRLAQEPEPQRRERARRYDAMVEEMLRPGTQV